MQVDYRGQSSSGCGCGCGCSGGSDPLLVFQGEAVGGCDLRWKFPTQPLSAVLFPRLVQTGEDVVPASVTAVTVCDLLVSAHFHTASTQHKPRIFLISLITFWIRPLVCCDSFFLTKSCFQLFHTFSYWIPALLWSNCSFPVPRMLLSVFFLQL